MSVIYLTLEQAKKIHSNTIAISGGGELGILDVGKLDSILTHIQNDDYYPTFAEKLTHLFFSSCKLHCFVDGNKRIALSLSTQMLLLNGYLYCAHNFMREMENISNDVAAGIIDKELLGDVIQAAINDDLNNEEIKLKILHAKLRGQNEN